RVRLTASRRRRRAGHEAISQFMSVVGENGLRRAWACRSECRPRPFHWQRWLQDEWNEDPLPTSDRRISLMIVGVLHRPRWEVAKMDVSRNGRRMVMSIVCSWFILPCATSRGQYDSKGIEPVAILKGALLLHGGGPVKPEIRQKFVELAGGKEARIVVIPTADPDNPLADYYLEIWKPFEPASIERVHAGS